MNLLAHTHTLFTAYVCSEPVCCVYIGEIKIYSPYSRLNHPMVLTSKARHQCTNRASGQ